MCIRDRSAIDELKKLRQAVPAGTPWALAIEEQLQKLSFSPCLLYTSDAADERSSVDLGGRRIIKKKNKVDIYTTCVCTSTRTAGLYQQCSHESAYK